MIPSIHKTVETGSLPLLSNQGGRERWFPQVAPEGRSQEICRIDRFEDLMHKVVDERRQKLFPDDDPAARRFARIQCAAVGCYVSVTLSQLFNY